VCGLCGVVHLDRPAEARAVERMLAELEHRGPDGRGVYRDEGVALGHLRLAIIDLSDAGLQPFASEDGRLQLLHNGEIYNYRELRAELKARGHRFHTATDTEVILAAYREWGEHCVDRFNGMWAFVLWDGEERTLFCSRDRFGIKPFYYRLDGSRFAFASEPRALREGTRANLAAVRDYVEQGYLDEDAQTFFDGVLRLPPAHNLVFGPPGLRVERYWRLEPHDPPADPVAAVRELFLDAVRLELRSDVPVGTCLSGGVDSSAIACAVSHLLRTEAENAAPVGERQKTVTAYFDDAGFDERPYARAVVERTDAEPHWVSFTAEELVDRLPAIVEAQGEPFGSTSICAGWHVMGAARDAGLTVMLDGQGGDEILAGYRAAFGYRLSDLLRRGDLREASAELGAFASMHGPRWAAVAVATPHVPERARLSARARLRGSSSLVHPELRAAARDGSGNGAPAFPDRLRRALAVTLTRRGLPELLRYEDRNSMAHSLEARVPFLDHRLVELAFSLDGGQLIHRGETKSVLRRALADLLPPEVRDRRDKLGFVTPEGRFLRGALGEHAAEVFSSPEFAARGFVDAPAARRRLERHRRGELEAGMELWRALNLELWARRFLDA
jgi:asparagine synthase (glutamine-hydrolysing)